MARPREFDRDEALTAAMRLFWEKGYADASAEDLVTAMGIGRQSMYDTFGDKQQLYLEALRRYHSEANGKVIDGLGRGPSPLEAIRTALFTLADREATARAQGCMGINATTAQGRRLPEVLQLAEATARATEAAFAAAVVAAQRAGELESTLDAVASGRFLYTTLQGLTVRAQAGAPPAELRETADFALEALRHMA